MSLTTSDTSTTVEFPCRIPRRKSSKNSSFITSSRQNRCVVCSHTEDTVTFPDGTRVLASGWLQRTSGQSTPDFGLYLDPQWTPTWPNVMLDWPDFGVPQDQATADEQIRAAFERARAGQRVEVACIGR